MRYTLRLVLLVLLVSLLWVVVVLLVWRWRWRRHRRRGQRRLFISAGVYAAAAAAGTVVFLHGRGKGGVVSILQLSLLLQLLLLEILQLLPLLIRKSLFLSPVLLPQLWQNPTHPHPRNNRQRSCTPSRVRHVLLRLRKPSLVSGLLLPLLGLVVSLQRLHLASLLHPLAFYLHRSSRGHAAGPNNAFDGGPRRRRKVWMWRRGGRGCVVSASRPPRSRSGTANVTDSIRCLWR